MWDKSRIVLKEKFVKRNRKSIELAMDMSEKATSKLITKARKELGYSDNTTNTDILSGLRNAFDRIAY